MKKSLAIILVLSIACSKPAEIESDLTNDTIRTASGLSYVYLKRGEGRKVEKGSELDTKLSLMVDDSVVWTSYESPDSLFTFVAGVGGVIKGFDEMTLLMREGDNVLAILPDSLAYGDDGSGDAIPPNSTLVYNRCEIISVSEPKMVSIDTLYAILTTDGVESVKDQFETIINDTLVFHAWGDYDDLLLLRKVAKDSSYTEVFQLAHYLGTLHDDPRVLGNMSWALQQQGQFQAAKDTLEAIMSRYILDKYVQDSFDEFMEELNEELAG